jgi:hypothetical protein
MTDFFPFIHKTNKEKKNELEPLYIELYPPSFEEDPEKKEEQEEPQIVIIEL